jgi:hypothetical protein
VLHYLTIYIVSIFSQTLSGWMGCVAVQLFSPEMFDQVKVRALTGPLKDIQRLVQKPLLHCVGCELGVVVLLEGEPPSNYEVLNTLEQVFIKDLSLLCC